MGKHNNVIDELKWWISDYNDFKATTLNVSHQKKNFYGYAKLFYFEHNLTKNIQRSYKLFKELHN